MDVHTDCRHFRTDRPCIPHKQTGQECPGCAQYSPLGKRILIIKLGAMGDVLRTTAILGPLLNRYPEAGITWVVAEGSEDLLRNNPCIWQIRPFNPSTIAELSVRRFDLVINLDLGAESLALASMARGEEKQGFGMGEHGEPVLFNPEAREWFELSFSDRLKKQNRETYQNHMLRILKLDPVNSRIVVNCPDGEKEWARRFLQSRKGNPAGPVVGFNIGAGGRWQYKRWTLEGYRDLAESLVRGQGASILLLAGPREKEARDWLMANTAVPLIDSGAENPFPRFAALIDQCDVLVTGDTLALHTGLGLGKRVVALFGPTSSHEIELYGLGTKIVADLDCLCCYLERCDKDPNCMNSISPERIHSAVVRELEMARGPA